MALLNNKRTRHGPYDKAIDRAKLVSSGQKKYSQAISKYFNAAGPYFPDCRPPIKLVFSDFIRILRPVVMRRQAYRTILKKH